VGEGQEMARPVGQMDVGQPRAAHDGATGVAVGRQTHVPFAVVEVLAPAVAVHDVDAAGRAGRVDEQGLSMPSAASVARTNWPLASSPT